MRSNLRKKWEDLNLYVEAMYRRYEYRKKAKIRLKRMNGGYECSKEYKEKVIPYWKQFGLKPKKYWFQIFSDREKRVDPRYIPDDIWFGDIIPYYSNPSFRRCGEDKCMHDVVFRNLKRPATIAKNIAGVFYDPEMNIISDSEAINLCNNFSGEFLIKPSIDSGEARMIQFFNKNSSKNELINCFQFMKANFIVQASVKQHPILAELNPSSLNTIRIVSFLFEGEVHILSSILRIGAQGHKVDNIGAGGFACPIKENGQLSERGVNRKAEWVTENNNGKKFAEVTVPSYQRLLETVKETHTKLAHFKLIGWDFAIDIEGDPVFIEFNSCPGPNQITCGPTFGDITDKVLRDVFITKSLQYAKN